ncbi:AGAP008627-PA-like protein [Anopheles sinensis]|uniref:AGAP008627-PA-like protein n=1 Tax=Anopheles sinensis TaxID=74873 RepID=A0A084WFW5_ANOSI|nr:AGAP008627-PA-like protein [Anopheles sinensis]
MNTADRLCIIPPAEWVELRDLYLVDWPEHHVAYTTIDNYIRWYAKDCEIKNLAIYSLNGTWRKDGTYLVVDRYQLFAYSFDTTNEKLEKAFHLLDWSGGLKVSSILKRHRAPLINVLEAKGLQKEYDSETCIYFMPKERCNALELKIPDGFELRSLTPEDAAKADDLWPNRHQGSRFFLERLAAWNPNVGLVERSTGTLVAWCFRLQAGPLGALQVDPKYLRRGFGTIVTVAVAKQIAALGQDCFALVNATNVPSRKMFERIMAKTADQLMEISYNEWSELRDIFRRDWPKHEFAFYILQNYVQWKAQEQALNVNIFSLNGNWRNDETFVLKDGFEIYFYSSDTDGDGSHMIRLLKLLELEKLPEISMDYLESHHIALTKVIADSNLLVKSSNMANYYFMIKEEVLAADSLPLPEGFAFSRLTPANHLDYVYNQWPLRSHISYEAGYGLLRRLLLLNESVGLFDADGVLVSWCLRYATIKLVLIQTFKRWTLTAGKGMGDWW